MAKNPWKLMLPQLVFWLAIIAAVGLAVGLALPPVLNALGAAIGLAGGLIGGTVVLSSAVAPWVVPTAAGGLAVGGAAAAVTIVVKVVSTAKERPFEWLAPVLGVASGFVVDFCSELYPYEGFFRVVFAGVASALVIGGSFLWRSNLTELRLVSVPVFLLAPALVLYWAGIENWRNGFLYTIRQVEFSTWAALLLFLVLLMSVAVLGYLSRPQKVLTK